MLTFIIPFPSEIIGALNFTIVDIILLSYIMYATSLMAGFSNHIVSRSGTIRPVVFNPPIIGGGLVMSRGRTRTVIIVLRISVVLAIATANFGLEGRSTVMEIQTGRIRMPGPLQDTNEERMFKAFEVRRRCASLEADDFVFHTVVDDKCRSDLSQYVFLRSLSVEVVKMEYNASGCRATPVCGMNYTKFICDGMDIACAGITDDSCPNGRTVPEFSLCHSVIYKRNTSFYCGPFPSPDSPNSANKPSPCRRMGATREDIGTWIDFIFGVTPCPMIALFGAAYSVEREAEIEMPREENVTVVTLFWIIPAFYVMVVCVGITTWLVVNVCRGNKLVANDERALSKLVQKMAKILETEGTDATIKSLLLHED